MTTIIGIRLDNRVKNSKSLQDVLTEFGCIIQTRLGLHNVSDGACPTNGLILLEIIDEAKSEDLIEKLNEISEIKISSMKI